MWIDEASDDILRTWAKHSPAMKLVSTLDGQILWANDSFLEWSQYTLNEIRRMTWMQLSVPDRNLEADIDELRRLDGYNPSYAVRKQYIPKGQAPEWGQLNVMRYPLTGEIQCCLCTWEPLKNGTARAFAMAMEHNQSIDRKIAEMTTEIQKLTNQTDEDKFVLGTIRLVQRHPKIAIVLLVMIASIFGLNNIVELLQRTGMIHLPVKVDPATPVGGIPPVSVNEVATISRETDSRVVTSSGAVIEWVNHDRRAVRVSGAVGSTGSGDRSGRTSVTVGSGEGTDLRGLHGRAL